MQHNNMHKFVALLGIAVMVIASCSGDDDGDKKSFEATVAQADSGPATDSGATEADIAAAVDSGPKEYACPVRKKCNRAYCDRVLIPGGTFKMGSEHGPRADAHFPAGDERPIHDVKLSPYCIDKYETTLERYEDCVEAGWCSPLGLKFVEKADSHKTVVNHYPKSCYSNMNSCRHRAVNAKNYFQAQHYCAWLGSRLCTEAEWERAANGPGPGKREHPWGNTKPTSQVVNIPSTGTGYVEEVDDYAAGQSPEGVFNLAGNVYEWVRDAYHPYQPTPDGQPLLDPVYPPKTADQYVVARGSCFFTEPARTVNDRSKMHITFDWG